jgi:DNA-binding response OmpR family regulator
MKLIIIEDDKELVISLKNSLESYGFNVDIAFKGQAGLDLIKKNLYDLIVLDLNLPDKNGQEIAETVRKNGAMIPILIISADYAINKRIALLNSWADDFLVKPFDILEFNARVRALLRRPTVITNPVIKIGRLKLDKEKKTVMLAEEEVYLTRKEFLLLEYLMTHRHTVVSRNELIEHVWDSETNFFSKTIEMHMMNLRNKIDSDKNHCLIKTISGRGYKME